MSRAAAQHISDVNIAIPGVRTIEVFKRSDLTDECENKRGIPIVGRFVRMKMYILVHDDIPPGLVSVASWYVLHDAIAATWIAS